MEAQSRIGKKEHRMKIKIGPNMIVWATSFFSVVNSNSPLKAWPCAVWQEIAAAWRQDATYHQGTRWLFNFTLPVAKTPVSVERHNGCYAGGAAVLVAGCKEARRRRYWKKDRGGRRRRRRSGVVMYVCVWVWPQAHAQINSPSAQAATT